MSRKIHKDRCSGYTFSIFSTGLSGQHFSFLPNGDGPARYRILNFRQTTPGQYSWDTVGYFDNGHLVDVSIYFAAV